MDAQSQQEHVEETSIVLTCPQCSQGGIPQRIGNRRGSCRTCNAFAQAVRRRLLSRLEDLAGGEADRIRAHVEIEEYRTRFGTEAHHA